MGIFPFACSLVLLALIHGVLSDYGATYYVATTGNDANPGTQSQPFKTLNHARDMIRNYKHSLPDGGVLVYIRGGTYINSNYSQYNVTLLDLSSQDDSGAAGKPIVYTSYPGEKVEIFGGYQVDSTAFVASTQYPDLLVADLSKLNSALWNIVDFGSIGSGELGQCKNVRSELFVNGQRMILSRWPNIYYEQQYSGVDIWNWTQIVNVTDANSFTYSFSNQRATKWSKETDAWVHGYWSFDWADSYTKIQSIDTAKQIIHTDSSTPPVYGYVAAARYYATNLLSELDTINEYYIDTQNKLVYISKLRANTLSTDKYYISVNPIVIKLASNIKYVSIENITIGYGVQSGLSATDVSNCNFNNLVIFGIGEAGLTSTGYNNAVTNNNITNIGCTGLVAYGGDQKSLTKGNNMIKNNFVKYYAQWHRTYVPGISFGHGGVSNSYIGNYVGYAPHNGFLGGSNDCLFEQNMFEMLCYEVSDSGGWYSGRSWTNRGNVINNNTFINLRNIEKIVLGSPNVQGVYLDDQISGHNVTNNIFVNCQRGIQLGGGRRTEIHGNKFASVDTSVSYDDRGLTWQSANCKPGGQFNQQLDSVNYKNPPWSTHYPYLPYIFDQQPCTPVFDHITNNEYCCGTSTGCKFIDDSSATCQSWNSTCVDNTQTSWSNNYC